MSGQYSSGIVLRVTPRREMVQVHSEGVATKMACRAFQSPFLATILPARKEVGGKSATYSWNENCYPDSDGHPKTEKFPLSYLYKIVALELILRILWCVDNMSIETHI